jgi:hypothetical protein
MMKGNEGSKHEKKRKLRQMIIIVVIIIIVIPFFLIIAATSVSNLKWNFEILNSWRYENI